MRNLGALYLCLCLLLIIPYAVDAVAVDAVAGVALVVVVVAAFVVVDNSLNVSTSSGLIGLQQNHNSILIPRK